MVTQGPRGLQDPREGRAVWEQLYARNLGTPCARSPGNDTGLPRAVVESRYPHLPGHGCEASTDRAVPQSCWCSNICRSACELLKRSKKSLKIRWIRVHWTLPFPLKQQAQRKLTNPGTACASSPRCWPERGAEALRTRHALQWAGQGGASPRWQCQGPRLHRRTWEELSS